MNSKSTVKMSIESMSSVKSTIRLLVGFSQTSAYLAASLVRSVLVASLFMLGYFLLQVDPASVTVESVLRHIQTKDFQKYSLYAGLALVVINNVLLSYTNGSQARKSMVCKPSSDQSQG
jgi:hypothetical protein